jgi:hypothetical protein
MAISTNTSVVSTSISTSSTAISTISVAISTVSVAISTVSTAVSTVSTAVSTVSTAISTVSTSISTVSTAVSTVGGLVAVTKAGHPQAIRIEIDCQQNAGAHDIVSCSTHDVIVDSLIADAGAFTGISIEDNDTTSYEILSAINGAKANLTQFKKIIWTGALPLRVGYEMQFTVYGGASTNPGPCYVYITYHATEDGGILTDAT